VTLAVVGDINGYNILQSHQDQVDPLQGINGLIVEKDIFVFNFEGVLLTDDVPCGTCRAYPGQSLFRSPSQIADYLHRTQLTIATLANNHSLDCGSCGIQETVRELTSRGILTVGAGENCKQACQPLRVVVNGVGLVLVSYLDMEPNPFSALPNRSGTASWEECSGEQQLAELAATRDIVVVALHSHLGQEWTDQPSPKHIALVQSILDAGADIVIAHGSHVPQGVLVRNGRVAFLSLGNFLFCPDYRMPDGAHDSVIAKVTISPDKFSIVLVPLRLDDAGRPIVPPPWEAHQIVRHIADLSGKLGTTVEIREETGYITVHR
jgi:poly-gamma-glutamate synthesis protein (capsule biosynthesis protein)